MDHRRFEFIFAQGCPPPNVHHLTTSPLQLEAWVQFEAVSSRAPAAGNLGADV
jgi:hypothetical protein